MMGFNLTERCSWLFFLLELVSVLQASNTTGTCETVFKGFSDCLLSLGENMVNYPQELDDMENLHTICSYWEDFHSCASTAIADCQEGAVDLWEKLKVQSMSFNYKGSLFELCSGDNAVPKLHLTPELAVFSLTLSNVISWLVF